MTSSLAKTKSQTNRANGADLFLQSAANHNFGASRISLFCASLVGRQAKEDAVMRKFAIGAIFAVVTQLGAGQAQAANITAYTDLASWQAAAGLPVALEDFADTTLVPGLSVGLGGGSITGGIMANSLAVFGLCVEGGAGCPATSSFSFAPSTTAFAADWDLAPGGAGSGIFFSVHLVGGGIQTVPGFVNPAAGGTFSGFYGFVSDTSFTTINLGSGFTGSGETFNADNVRFRTAGDSAAVPEPGTLVLTGIGLVGLAKSRRARQRADRAQRLARVVK
jgi:hypothetical protein